MSENISIQVEEITQREFNVYHVNSIGTLYKELRNKSKAPTFALTYAGTHHTLMKNCGFSKEEALQIEQNYHDLYQTSDKWVADKLAQACKDGYVTLAFGLKLRTPLLAKSILKTRVTLNQAEKEARTAGNAISGQSYGMLTNRAMVAVMKRVWDSEYRFAIHPCAMIHDALYFIVEEDADCIQWFNEVLIEEMQWQNLPELIHDSIHLGAELELFHPNWGTPIAIPNHANKETIIKLCKAS